ncbi:MAG TPA: alpha/beta fold hydrolase [Candidatus Cybelea sp.]|jgi:proline iminopeptidase|nr:alpha/beta fold hydrolase [Candidatus Cybelea sp.]
MNVNRCLYFLPLVVLTAFAAWASQSDDASNRSSEAHEQTFTRSQVTSIIGTARKIVAPNGIEELLEIPIGGTKQWISVRGRDRGNPVLLMIHGGPASPEMPSSWFFENSWEDYFTVVQWDQRGSGKSYNTNEPRTIQPTITADRMINDAGEVVQFLRKRYEKNKIFVLGHSWGSLVGISVAHAHPDWLYAYIGTGQMINGKENERVGYANTLRAAEAAGNPSAIAELKAIAPYPEMDGSVPLEKLGKERHWSVVLGGLTYRRTTYDYYENLFKLSPEYSEQDVAAIDKGSALSLGALIPAILNFNYSDTIRFKCPIILFEGRHDDTTPAEVAAQWFKRVRAPDKKLVWFENSAHMAMVEEPGRFLVHLVQDVRPLAEPPLRKP